MAFQNFVVAQQHLETLSSLSERPLSLLANFASWVGLTAWHPFPTLFPSSFDWRYDNPELDSVLSLTELSDCIFMTWSPTIGDPTLMGWVTVVSYVAASVLAALVFYRKAGRQRIFWLGLLALLLVLAINKQLDLQSALTAAARCIAKAQGWYAERQSVQIKFIFSIIGTSLLAALLLAWAMRRELVDIWLALIGIAFLLAFIAIRAAGLHHFDQFIGYKIGSIHMNWILEIGGIAMIAVNALYLLLRRSKRDS